MANLEESFHASVRENNRSAIEVLLKKGVNINCFYYGMTALHVAITKGMVVVFVFLCFFHFYQFSVTYIGVSKICKKKTYYQTNNSMMT